MLSFSDPARGIGWNPHAPADPALAPIRARRLLDALGAPDRSMLCVLIAGTKGKGSTAVFLASVLSAAGVRAGLFTSPHLQDLRERVRIDGALVGRRSLGAGIDRARAAVATLEASSLGPPSTFEILTAVALERFAAAGCRVAVLEVGLGGRYDATNATEPAVSVITPISRDHTALLGTTLARIAREKSGIMRPGRPVLLALQRPSAQKALALACRSLGARCRTVRPLGRGTPLSLAGAHQRQNAALAAAAAAELRERGIAIGETALIRGLARVRWPGRFELIERRVPVVLDGAHNDASAAALAATLRERFPRRRVHLILGIARDKDARAVIRPLRALATSIIATSSGSPRALAPDELARIIGRRARSAADAGAALAAALGGARPNDVVCVAGSLALVGAARDALGLRPLQRLW